MSLRDRLRDRNRWPRLLNRAIDLVAERPAGLIGRLAARRYGRGPADVPMTELPKAARRVVIAPVNYSGQARAWASALQGVPDADIAAVNFAVDVPGGFAFAADLVVPVGTIHNDHDWQRRQFEAVASQATHVLIEAEEPPFGRLLGRSTERQARALLERGVDVAFVAHGTDIRLPSRHMARTAWSHYSNGTLYLPRLEHLARTNRELLDRLERPVFVSTPDLLADVGDAKWCPVVVDIERWSVTRSMRNDSRLRVAHAPSQPAQKGTPLISPTMERLADAGLVSWELIHGVPSAEMPRRFATVDILLDQFMAGSYGVAAVEALAAGCVVVGHVLPDVRAVVRDQTGLDLPIVEATPDTLESVIRALIDTPAEVERLRERGVAFAREVHDGRRSAAVLATWVLGTDH